MTARPCSVVTALAPLPHPRFSRFFAQIKQDLGFGIYVPDCDTTACAFSAATQAGSTDPILDQPLLDFYAGYQVRGGANEPLVTVPLNDNIDYEGGVVTWIDNLDGERPFGNDLDPTLNLDILEVSLPQSAPLEDAGDAAAAARRCTASSASRSGWSRAARSPIRARTSIICRSSIAPISAAAMRPSWRCRRRRERRSTPTARSISSATRVLAYVQTELIAGEMNAFDAALALIALGHLGADAATFTPALHCIVAQLGEGGRHGPFRAYEWNKMKTPTRILVGGPEVTSAFVLMGLALARRAMTARERLIGAFAALASSARSRVDEGFIAFDFAEPIGLLDFAGDARELKSALQCRRWSVGPIRTTIRRHMAWSMFEIGMLHAMKFLLARFCSLLLPAVAAGRRHHRRSQDPRGRPDPDRHHPHPARRHRRAVGRPALPQQHRRALDLRRRRARRTDQACRQQELDLPRRAGPTAAAAWWRAARSTARTSRNGW